MQVILLERIAKLGKLGEIVQVKNGYARNYLLPMGKALRATEANKALFESKRAELEARHLERKALAEETAKCLEGKSFTLIRSAGENDQLYGSVSSRDIAMEINGGGYGIHSNQVELKHPLKTIGVHNVTIALDHDVTTHVLINIARSAEEAERQAHADKHTETTEEEALLEQVAEEAAEKEGDA